MLKKIGFIVITTSFWILPTLTFAADILEPPNLVETRIDSQFIDKAKVSFPQDKVLVLEGTAKAGSQVYLYISTDQEPLFAKVDVDSAGNWLYDLNQALSVGKHSIEGETHQGNKISAKVNLLDFNVKKGKLPFTLSNNWIIFISVISLLVILGVIILIRKLKKNNLSNTNKTVTK